MHKRTAHARKNEQKRRQEDVEQNIGDNESEGDNDNSNVHISLNPATMISKDEHRLLQNFRNKMDNICYKLCTICNERIPSMTLIKKMCRRCYTEKIEPKKFSVRNNIDPGKVPDELQGLTEIEEMLIAQIFTVMMIYRLRGGQNGYKGNIINRYTRLHKEASTEPFDIRCSCYSLAIIKRSKRVQRLYCTKK